MDARLVLPKTWPEFSPYPSSSFGVRLRTHPLPLHANIRNVGSILNLKIIQEIVGFTYFQYFHLQSRIAPGRSKAVLYGPLQAVAGFRQAGDATSLTQYAAGEL